jgi:MarR family transcriptional regulator, organic hydroperoxide resistance regulator
MESVTTATEPRTTPAHEAQKLFFEIGMDHRARVGTALTELGLTFAQAHALRLLDPERPLPMSSLADRLFCDASNVTGIADRLESRGLVERRSAEGDRRVKALTLTPAGVELRRRVLGIMSEPPAAIASLSVADQRALRDILRRAVEHLHD